MLQIVVAVGFFTASVLIMVLIILAARKILVPEGTVKIVINEDESSALQSSVGGKLLQKLSEHEIFIPSACGGAGTCGLCKATVVSGGGTLLPTEEAYVNKKEANKGVRLACQVDVKEDMQIELPASVFNTLTFQSKVLANNHIAAFINELILEIPKDIEFNYKSGGYIQIKRPAGLTVKFSDMEINPKFRPDWERDNLFELVSVSPVVVERGYSMANYPAEEGIIMLNVRVATPPNNSLPPGVVSSWIFNLKPGEMVELSGPYGHFFAQDTEAEMVLLGSGAGMAPLRSIVLDELLAKNSKRKISFWYGARNIRTLIYNDVFKDLEKKFDNFRWGVALSRPDADWKGAKGYVQNICFNEYLKDHETPEECEYYLCGPANMMKSVLEMLDSLGVPEENIFFDDFG